MASEINRLTDFVKKRPGRKTFKLIHWSSDLRKEAFIRSVQLTEPIEIYREVHGFNIKIKSCIIVMISYDLQITPRHNSQLEHSHFNAKTRNVLSLYQFTVAEQT